MTFETDTSLKKDNVLSKIPTFIRIALLTTLLKLLISKLTDLYSINFFDEVD